MEQGGNKNANEFFRANGVNGNLDYRSPVAEKWRNHL